MKDFKPYYVVIFTSTQTPNTEGYSEMAEQMETLAKHKNWKQQSDHVIAQQKGRSDWYSWYNVRICKVEREYEFTK